MFFSMHLYETPVIIEMYSDKVIIFYRFVFCSQIWIFNCQSCKKPWGYWQIFIKNFIVAFQNSVVP